MEVTWSSHERPKVRLGQSVMKDIDQIGRESAPSKFRQQRLPSRSLDESKRLMFTAKQSYTADSADIGEPTALAYDELTLEQCREGFDPNRHFPYWIYNHYVLCGVHYAAVTFYECTSSGACTPVGIISWRVTFEGDGFKGARWADFGYYFDEWASDGRVDWSARVTFGVDCFSFDGDCFDQSLGLYVSNTLSGFRSQPDDTRVLFAHFTLENIPGTGPDTLSYFQAWTWFQTSTDVLPSYAPDIDFRCDKASYANGQACIFHNVRAFWSLSVNDAAVNEAASHIYDAFTDITRTEPGVVGTYVPGNYADPDHLSSPRFSGAVVTCRRLA
jgi:hypothetical protein